jgi:hypothetical protein
MVNIATIKAEDLRAEREREYGTYVAREEIRIDGVLAFGIGYPVPVGHTEEYPELLEPGEDGKPPVITVEEYEAEREAEAEEAAAAVAAKAPAKSAPRSAWTRYATAQGADESETVAVKDGGLSRDQLADKYGA